MTAVVSVPTYLRGVVGGDLCRDKPEGIPTMETPDRTYFLLPLLDLWGHRMLYSMLYRSDIEIEWFWTPDEATEWSNRDALMWRVH